jgi:hypothetical protein
MHGVKQNLLIDQDWFWHDYVKLVEEGQIDRTAGAVLENSGCPLWIYISAYEFNKVPQDGEKRESEDSIDFVMAAGDEVFSVSHPGGRTTSVFANCSNSRDLIDVIKEHRDLDFFWLNICYGIRLKYGEGSADGWDEEMVWEKAFSLWNNYIS